MDDLAVKLGLSPETVEALLEQINDGAPPRMYELESRIIVRESTINFVSA